MKKLNLMSRLGLLGTAMLIAVGGFFVAEKALAVTANINHLAITTEAQTISVSVASSVITVQTRNAEDTAEQLDTSGTTVSLASSSATGEFSSNSETWEAVTTLGMNNGTANRNFYYKDSVPGTYTITISADGWTEATQSIVVEGDVPPAAGPVFIDDNTNGTFDEGESDFETIQEAVDAANPGDTTGDTIVVTAGTYDSFSVVDKSDLTISGAGQGETIIEPTTLVTTSTAHKYTANMLASVFVNGSTGITIQNMTIKSNDQTPGSGGPDAIVFWNASTGTIGNCDITGVYTINGVQSGQGIAIDASGSQASDLSVEDSNISGFQKNGIEAIDGNGATSGATDTITISINGGSITGAGPTDAIAQNGVLAWNRGGGGVSASIDGTEISGFSYTGDATAAGVLAYGGGNIMVNNSTLTNNQLNVSNVDSPQIDASKNYWGSEDGPVAESIEGDVIFSPWFSDADMTELSTTLATTLPVTVGALTIDIPDDITITGDENWDGLLETPTATTVTLDIPGFNTDVSSAIALGSSLYDLTFDKAVKLTFAGQAGKHIGWYDAAGDFTEITDDCNATGGDDQALQTAQLGGEASCKMDVGENLIVFTKHFSTFLTYTTEAESAGSSSGSRRNSTAPSTPGQILGAETGPDESFVFTLSLKMGPPYQNQAEVMELQKFLNAAGFGPLVIDGKFGPLTKDALVKFQLANGLVGDGVVGPLTRAVLNK
ncbi:MAG: peptidoglycan-binding protein [Candidatus Paceibacterota bacterium]|jgi:hypothetical protein